MVRCFTIHGGLAKGPRLVRRKAGPRTWRVWLRSAVALDARLQPNHAWRHTFKTRAMGFGIDVRVRDAIAGHEASDVARGYEDPPLPLKIRAMKKFKGYSLDPETDDLDDYDDAGRTLTSRLAHHMRTASAFLLSGKRRAVVLAVAREGENRLNNVGKKFENKTGRGQARCVSGLWSVGGVVRG